MFYTYLWLREDGTPYYVGKGKKDRAFISHSHRVNRPKDTSFIIIQEWESEQDSFRAEKFLILYYGRKDLGTGCLRNLTNGGEGSAGRVSTEFFRESLSARRKGKRVRITPYTKEQKSAISVRMMGNRHGLGHKPRLGSKASSETRQKMSLSQRRRRLEEASCLIQPRVTSLVLT